MNSNCQDKSHSSPLKSKAKAMAIKYQKYCKKKSMQQTCKPILCLQKWVKKCNQTLANIWNLVMPVVIRGTVTPYQSFIRIIPRQLRNQLQTLPFSHANLGQAIQKSRIAILISYSERSLPDLLQKLNNNQQINSLINKKAQILPILLKTGEDQTIEGAKLKEMAENLALNITDEHHVFVLWKGLYDQILIIARFQLTDPDLSIKVLRAVQQRQDYQQLIKKLAGQSNNVCQQSSLNQLSQQSTGISKQGSD